MDFRSLSACPRRRGQRVWRGYLPSTPRSPYCASLLETQADQLKIGRWWLGLGCCVAAALLRKLSPTPHPTHFYCFRVSHSRLDPHTQDFLRLGGQPSCTAVSSLPSLFTPSELRVVAYATYTPITFASWSFPVLPLPLLLPPQGKYISIYIHSFTGTWSNSQWPAP